MGGPGFPSKDKPVQILRTMQNAEDMNLRADVIQELETVTVLQHNLLGVSTLHDPTTYA